MHHRMFVVCLLFPSVAQLADAQGFPMRQPLGIYARDTAACTPPPGQKIEEIADPTSSIWQLF